MNDTSPEIESIFYTMMMEKSGEERLMMGFAMFDMARMQVEATIRANKPNAGSQEIRKEIFLRFYEQEFSPEEQENILRKILA